MSTNDDFPTFDPSMLSQEPEDEDNKVTWKPDRKAIEKALGECHVRVNMPRIFFSADEDELAEAIGLEAEFRDELIDRYEMLKDEVTSEILIHVYPLEDDSPFWLKVTDKGLEGPAPKKSLYLIEKPEGCYKESDDTLPYQSTAFRIA